MASYLTLNQINSLHAIIDNVIDTFAVNKAVYHKGTKLHDDWREATNTSFTDYELDVVVEYTDSYFTEPKKLREGYQEYDAIILTVKTQQLIDLELYDTEKNQILLSDVLDYVTVKDVKYKVNYVQTVGNFSERDAAVRIRGNQIEKTY